MSDVVPLGYRKYYTGGCLLKIERDMVGNYTMSEIHVCEGRAFLLIHHNDGTEDEYTEEHELGIVDVKPLERCDKSENTSNK